MKKQILRTLALMLFFAIFAVPALCAPSISSSRISFANITQTTYGYCNATNSNDGIFYNYTWYRNNVLLRNNTAYNFPTISGGYQHTCAIRANDSRVLCWGWNSAGQLGENTTTQRNIPTLTNDTSAYTAVSAGFNHTCAIRKNDSRVLCWGDNSVGELGNNNTGARKTIPTLTNDTSAYSAISVGFGNAGSFSCGIRANDSRVMCWGSNAYGALGDNNGPNHNIPKPTSDTSAYATIMSGWIQACGIRANDSRVLCWGDNSVGQLGDNTTNTRYIPTLTNDTSAYSSIGTGRYFSCGTRANDSRVLCWGQNTFGQLGNNNTGTDQYSPTLTNDTSAYKMVGVGYNSGCGIRANDSRILCWGYNGYGQLGDNTTIDHNIPKLTKDATLQAILTVGTACNCIIRSNDSRVMCWGYGSSGDIGDNTVYDHNVSTLTSDTSAYNVGFVSGKEVRVDAVYSSQITAGDRLILQCCALNTSSSGSCANTSILTSNSSCTPTGFGEWLVDAKDNCSLSNQSIVLGGKLILSGALGVGSLYFHNTNISAKDVQLLGYGNTIRIFLDQKSKLIRTSG